MRCRKCVFVYYLLLVGLFCSKRGDEYQIPGTAWERAYVYGVGYSVEETIDGGYVVTGRGLDTLSQKLYLLKTDGGGNVVWQKFYGDINGGVGYSVQQTHDGGYIIAGQSSDHKLWLLKVNVDGDTVWAREYSCGSWASFGSSVTQTNDGGYAVFGYVSAGAGDVLLLRTDAQGDTLWTRTFGGADLDIGYDGHQTSDGGYIIAGLAGYDYASAGDVYLVRTDAGGNLIWERTYGYGYEVGNSVRQTIDGGFVVAGFTNANTSGEYDFYAIRVTPDGDTLWTRTYGGIQDEHAQSIDIFSDDYLVAGWTESYGSGSTDIYIMRIDDDGDTLWTVAWGQAESERAEEIKVTTDNGFIVTGEKGARVFLTKAEP
jgi:hypothetical protein